MPAAKGSIRYVNTITGEVRITHENLGEPWKPVKKLKEPKPSRKGRQGFYNPETGESGLFTSDPGVPWIPGGCSRGKGLLVFHNPDTGEEIRSKDDPGLPWVRGFSQEHKSKTRNVNLGVKQARETIDKRASSLKRRIREEGFSDREIKRHRKSSENLKGTRIPDDVREKISQTLSGRKNGFNSKRSRSTAERLGCDTFYILKITTPSGIRFGKWGSTSNKHSKGRWKAIKSKGYNLEIVFFIYLGKSAPEVEELFGKVLCKYPPSLPSDVCFGGYTETFEWSETTQEIINYFCYEMEKSTPSQGNWGEYWDTLLQGFCPRYGGWAPEQRSARS